MKHFAWLLLLILISCGKNIKDSGSNRDALEEPSMDGNYYAILSPVNGSFSSSINGVVLISKFGDEFKVNVRLKNAPVKNYFQGLYSGYKCPGHRQDRNSNEEVSSLEAYRVVGRLLLPLDGDLSSWERGQDLILRGDYIYKESTSYSLLLSDLEIRDGDFPLERKVVLISLDADNELPVACGVLTKVSNRKQAIKETEVKKPSETSEAVRSPVSNTLPPTEVKVEAEEPVMTRWSRWKERLARWRAGLGRWWRGSEEVKETNED